MRASYRGTIADVFYCLFPSYMSSMSATRRTHSLKGTFCERSLKDPLKAV